MMSFEHFNQTNRNSKLPCNCPEGTTSVLEIGDTCLCADNEVLSRDPVFPWKHSPGMTASRNTVTESIASPSHPIEFSAYDYCDLVTMRLSSGGMEVRIGSSGYFAVPAEQHARVWLVVADIIKSQGR